MEQSTLQQLAFLAGIVVAVVGMISLVWGVWTYRRTAQAQTEVMALGTLHRYLDLAAAHPDLASPGNEQPIDPRYNWFAIQALVTAEILWLYMGRRRADWRPTINTIVRLHQPYLRSGAFACQDFKPEFVSYLRERVSDLKCADVSDAK